ncbi:hypothetical protein HNR46_000775 [Haloferula luteola]|uniref:Uncharacterized protein n=1 Tax=Haloferula luteola TaxID=595692 RepID=A0A840UWL3_9BACT|nr:hypothetical protein [Haloferula luteola]MBB5350547.1 hypothetical protein [Haloferula luteola]
MFSASKLTEDQKADLHRWASEGASIADLQKQLKTEHGIGITYMDARFLVLDLNIEIQEEKDEPAQAVEEGAEVTAADGAPLPTGDVSVSVDSVAVPGAMVSGKVVFSDGETAIWAIDQYGRPGLDPDTPGYRPSQEDVASFQKQLSELLRKQGF